MAFKNKKISNPVTKHDIQFLQTASDTHGQMLEMISTYRAQSKEPPAHYHPYQQEDFTVLSGELSVRIDGEIKILKQGETLHIPKNKVHTMWNAGSQETVVNWKVQPAMDTEYFLETAIGLAKDGKTNENSKPGILQVALMANRYNKVFRLAKPAYFVQRILFVFLTPFAYLSGYRPTYKKYID